MVSQNYNWQRRRNSFTYRRSLSYNGKTWAGRGGDYHFEAVEWFTIIEGNAILKLEDIETHERLDIEMSLEKAITVFIPSNVAHIVVNNSNEDFILLAYTDKIYDPSDTIAYVVE